MRTDFSRWVRAYIFSTAAHTPSTETAVWYLLSLMSEAWRKASAPVF
jgi:hypothetical protein